MEEHFRGLGYLVLRFMGPVVASMGRRQERRIWTSLKQLLEAQPR